VDGIGSMLELGADSGSEHKKLGERLARSKAGAVFLFGGETREALGPLREAGMDVFHTEDMDALKAALKEYLKPGDFVLLKGSRGCALERAL
jgi:UDP-N-acetylmuramoyl-tripeptide--D-alanyl-D-alanine ligase